MSGISYQPPTEDLPIFDSSVFLAQVLATQAHVASNYVQYPNAQGVETFPGIVVSGTSALQTTTTGMLTATNTGGGNQIRINDSANVGQSTITQNGGSLGISAVSNTVAPQTTLTFSTRSPLNAGVVLFNGNSTQMNIGNATTLNFTGGTTCNIDYPTLNTQAITLAVNTNITQSGSGSIIQGTTTSVTNSLGIVACGSAVGLSQIKFRSYDQGVFSNLFMNGVNTYLQANNASAGPHTPSTLRLSTSTASNVFSDIVVMNTIALSIQNTADISLNSTNPPTSTATQPLASDTSTKMPTTAWTQGAISAGTALNATNVGVTGITTGTMYLAGNSASSTGIYPLQTDSLGRLKYEPSTNTLTLSGTGAGTLALTSSTSQLSILGTGTAISCPLATSITFPSANVLAVSFTGSLIGNASKATLVSVLSDNTSGSYFLPFMKNGASLFTTQQLYVDDTTGPLTYDPSVGMLTCAGVTSTLTGTSTGLVLPTTALNAGFITPTLTITGNSLSMRNSTYTFLGTTNTISSLGLSTTLTNGKYYCTLLNNGSGILTVNTGLGVNIKTKYTSAVLIAGGASALMTINVLLIGATATTIVDCYAVA